MANHKQNEIAEKFNHSHLIINNYIKSFFLGNKTNAYASLVFTINHEIDSYKPMHFQFSYAMMYKNYYYIFPNFSFIKIIYSSNF